MKVKFISGAVLALLLTACNHNFNYTGGLPYKNPAASIVLSQQGFAELEKEYAAFSTKALTQSYLKNKLKKWLASDGVKLVKEIEFCRVKGESTIPFKALMEADIELYDDIISSSAVTQAIGFGNVALENYLGGINMSLASPDGLVVTSSTLTGFTASWSPVSDATAYEISIDNSTPVRVTGTSYSASGLTGTNHTFKVRAVKNSAPGDYSTDFLVILSPALPANTIVVKADATGSGNGTSWTNAYTSLQAALAAATSGKAIWIAAGTYKPTTSITDRTASFQTKSGVNIYGGFAGNESLLSQRNFQANPVILSGDIAGDDADTAPSSTSANKADNVYQVVKGASSATIDGLTIKFGYYSSGNGGGMYNYNVSPNLNNITFTKNYAANGGALYNSGTSATTITKSVFSYNAVINNNSSLGYGGAIHNTGTLTINNSVLHNNTSRTGGGIYNNSALTVTNSVFHHNSATGGSGGSVYHSYGLPSSFTNVTFYSGGFYSYTGDITLRNRILWGVSIYLYEGILRVGYSNINGGYSSISGYYPSIRNLNGNTISSDSTYSSTSSRNINADPKFVSTVNIAGADGIYGTSDDGLKLQAGSPSINTGITTSAPTTDITGKARSTPDMGAYEY